MISLVDERMPDVDDGAWGKYFLAKRDANSLMMMMMMMIRIIAVDVEKMVKKYQNGYHLTIWYSLMNSQCSRLYDEIERMMKLWRLIFQTET